MTELVGNSSHDIVPYLRDRSFWNFYKIINLINFKNFHNIPCMYKTGGSGKVLNEAMPDMSILLVIQNTSQIIAINLRVEWF